MANNDKSNIFFQQPIIQEQLRILTADEKGKQISKEDKEKLAKNFSVMFFAVSAINWANGMTLGQAWQKSLEHLETFVKTRENIDNPVYGYLRGLMSMYRAKWSETIMKSPNSNKKLELPEKYKEQWLKTANKEYSNSFTEISTIYNKYEPPHKTHAKYTTLVRGQRKIQSMFMQNMMNQNQH